MACSNDKEFTKLQEESNPHPIIEAQTEELRKLTVTRRMATLFKKHIGNNWEDFGALLELSDGDLDYIKTSYTEPKEMAGAVLQKWRDKEGINATVGCLVSVLIQLEKKRIADELLDTVREEKRRKSEQNDDRSEEHRKTFSSPLEARSVKGKLDDESKRVARLENERRNNLTKLKSQRAEGKLRQCQVGERGSPETMPCSAEEPANASRTRNISLRELKESLQTVGKMDQAWTRMEPRVDEPPRRQQNMGSNEPLKTMQNPLMEEAALKEAIEKSIVVYIVLK